MPVKYYIQIALVIAAIAFLVWLGMKIKEVGYNECTIEHVAAADAALAKKVKEQKKELDTAEKALADARKDSSEWKAKAKELEDAERNRPKKPPTPITRINPAEQCTTLDIDIVRMFNVSGDLYRERIDIINK